MIATLKEIAHSEQRYPTVGDWSLDDSGVVTISVSKMTDPDYVFLVQLHELIEVYLCRKRGITQHQVDKFDMEYEIARVDGDFSEPGDSKLAPYYREHQFATKIEKLMAEELGVDWEAYDRTVCEL